jgi:hypothetical protein
MPTVTANCSIRVTKGCKTLGIAKGDIATILEVRPMGTDYSYFVRVTLRTARGKTHVLWARHMNRLGDAVVRLHNGDPTKNIEFVVLPARAPTRAIARSVTNPLTVRMAARARGWMGGVTITTSP